MRVAPDARQARERLFIQRGFLVGEMGGKIDLPAFRRRARRRRRRAGGAARRSSARPQRLAAAASGWAWRAESCASAHFSSPHRHASPAFSGKAVGKNATGSLLVCRNRGAKHKGEACLLSFASAAKAGRIRRGWGLSSRATRGARTIFRNTPACSAPRRAMRVSTGCPRPRSFANGARRRRRTSGFASSFPARSATICGW